MNWDQDYLLKFRWAKKNYYSELLSKHSKIFPFFEKRQLKGYAFLRILGKSAEVIHWNVEKNNNKTGFRCFESLLKQFRFLKMNKIFLECRSSHSKASRLYKKAQFQHVATRENYYLNGEAALCWSLKT